MQQSRLPEASRISPRSVPHFPLTTEGEKYTTTDLAARVAKDTGVLTEDANIAVAELMAQGYIKANDKGLVYLVTRPPMHK